MVKTIDPKYQSMYNDILFRLDINRFAIIYDKAIAIAKIEKYSDNYLEVKPINPIAYKGLASFYKKTGLNKMDPRVDKVELAKAIVEAGLSIS